MLCRACSQSSSDREVEVAPGWNSDLSILSKVSILMAFSRSDDRKDLDEEASLEDSGLASLPDDR